MVIIGFMNGLINISIYIGCEYELPHVFKNWPNPLWVENKSEWLMTISTSPPNKK
jgi:hypothetical protein